jgi:TRAP-type C4-dicarboxylate transport system permease small subunit
VSGLEEAPHPPIANATGPSLSPLGRGEGWGEGHLRAAMDALYRLCVVVSGSALVLISAVIPWGVFTRYVLNSAASWPEPMAILLTIVLTFIGAAACYRAETHMRVSILVRALSRPWQRLIEPLAEALTALLSLFMVIWGARLVVATWHQSIAEFPALSVGVTYLPIPIGGAITLLFVAERMLIGRPPQRGELHGAAAQD